MGWWFPPTGESCVPVFKQLASPGLPALVSVACSLSPVCVAGHIGERGGQVDESGEAADEVDADKGILDREGIGDRVWSLLARGKQEVEQVDELQEKAAHLAD